MLTWLKKLFTDETVFVRFVRSLVMLGGVAVQQGEISGLPPVVGALLMAAAVFVGAGEKNPQ